MDEDLELACYDNLFEAVPKEFEDPLNSIEIWHKCRNPKFRWTRFKKELFLAHKDGFLQRIGLEQGPQ